MFHALTLAAALDGIFTLTDRTDTRVRDPDPITNRAAIDIDTTIDARMVLHSRKDLYTLAYIPLLSLLDVNDVTRTTTFLNAGLASAEWNWPRARLSLVENGSYGRETFASLVGATPGMSPSTSSGTSPGQPPLTPQLVPVAETFFYESSVTTLTSSVRVRPWTLLASIGYQLSGGTGQTVSPPVVATTTANATAAAEAGALPLQKGPFGDLRADYGPTARDHLITDLKGNEAAFSNGPDDLIVDLEERWAHRWSRSTDTLIAGGAAGTRTRQLPETPYVFGAGPVAEIAVNEHLSRGKDQFRVRIDARLAPTINPLLGSVDESILGSVTTSWTHRRLMLQVLGTAGETVDQGTSTAYRSLQGELDVAYRVSDILSFDGGARLLTETQNELTPSPNVGGTPTVTAVPFTQGLVFVAVTIHAVKAKF
jgi:hypothetical protein